MTIDSSGRRLRTSINSGPGQGAQRLGEGLALRVIGNRRAAAHDIDQLANLVPAYMNDVTIDVIRSAASGHELHQRAPSLHHGRRDTGAQRTGAQRAAFLLELL